MKKTFQIGKVYYRPLLPSDGLRGIDPDKILRKLQKDVLKRMRANLLQTTFSIAAKRALAAAIKIEVKPSSILITANHPAYISLVEGQHGGQMKWLKKAKRPIPIITDSGKMIFRWASPRSFKNGKWVHPGHKPSDFLDKARQDARDHLKKALAKELNKQIKAALTKGRTR